MRRWVGLWTGTRPELELEFALEEEDPEEIPAGMGPGRLRLYWELLVRLLFVHAARGGT